MQQNKNFKILYVSAEVSPYAKTGGLADVAGSLPQELAAMGNDVRIVMPRFKSINTKMQYVTDFPVMVGSRKETCVIRKTEMEYKSQGSEGTLPVYFTDSYHYFDRDGIYCYFDDADRFAFFCRSVLEMLPRLNFQPDIIHCNDWHTGPICMLLKEEYNSYPFYEKIATVFTVHNLEYQGNFPKDAFYLFNLDENVFIPQKAEFYGMFGFMKTGIVYADKINTVSGNYAREILTEKYGEKLDGLLNERKEDLSGIVNGVSYIEFNPMIDKRIYRNYSAENHLAKKENKAPLQQEMGLPVRDVPVLGLVSRLTGQKGLDLISEIADELMKEDLQFILLGSGDEYYETSFKALMEKYPEKISIATGFNASLAQRIYAGSDMFLMPSRFEPCGLGQIISLRYGTIPVVRATGGLADTVRDIDEDQENGNGFVFDDFSSEELLKAIKRALSMYNGRPAEWERLVKKALMLDYSWRIPARKYVELYRKAADKK